jgi:hypothetical protein
MNMRLTIAVGCVCFLIGGSGTIAQQAPPTEAFLLLQQAEAERSAAAAAQAAAAAKADPSAQTVAAAQAAAAANMVRELERRLTQLRATRVEAEQVRSGGREQGGGGGRGGAVRTGGAGPLATFDPRGNDPMSGPVVANAPFSADAVTVVTQTLGDGTNITQRATAKFYRDGTGRIRREQTIMGIDALNPRGPGQPMTVVTLDSEPGDPRPYQLDAAARTARRVARGSAASPGGNITMALTVSNRGIGGGGGGGVIFNQFDQVDQPVNFQGLIIPRRGIPSDLRPTEEQLGTRQMEGLKVTGRRTTVTIPTDRLGNDRPIQVTDERWESPELGVVVYSRYSDPRTGVVEYRLTSVNRSEPRADLFAVPSDYTVVGQEGRGLRGGAPPPAPEAPGQRGAGGRGGRSPQ